MSVELRPLGVPCNLRCQYCYQNPQRDAAPTGPPYDLAAMKAAIEAEGGPFGLFGGEPLLVSEDVLEDLFAWGLARFGENGIQTNGSLLTERHIELFRTYRVRVGISVDGPGPLNDARWAGTLELTRQASEKSHAAIVRLCHAGMPPSLIITLHRGNASAERLELLADWLGTLPALGIRHVRLHLLEVEDEEIRRKYALSDAENLRALRRLQPLAGLHLDVFEDLDHMLQGSDRAAACVFRACDPYTTAAVRGVEGQGQRSNCGRTNKDGIEFGKASEAGYERYLALYQTPQAAGGCQGCRFFLMCKGHCPGTAIAGDWRNRSEHCEVYKELLAEREQQSVRRGETPLSLSPLRPRLEQAMLAEWSRGDNPPLASLRERVEQGLSVAAELAPRRRPVRSSWVSAEAQALWEPRLGRIRTAWAELSWRSATAGLRPCAVTRLLPRQLATRETELSATGHALRLLDPKKEGGLTLEHQVVLGVPAAVLELRAAWNRGDEETVGRLLGYPDCCTQRYAPVALPFSPPSPLLNALWRPLGLCAVPHQICAPTCEHSIDLAERLLAFGQALGFGEEIDWLRELLRWPVAWSCLHGIAEVRTPLLKFTYWTDYTDERLDVRYAGADYPLAGARGLHFPYPRPEHLKVSESRGHQRGLANPIDEPTFHVGVASLLRHGPR